MKYSVSLLLTANLKEVLLVKKNHTSFEGKWNGVGGEMIPGEPISVGALREIREETGLISVNQLTHLGTLIVPDDCKHPEDAQAELYWFAGVIPLGYKTAMHTDTGEELRRFDVESILESPITQVDYLAGDGDIPYFLYQATKVLKPEML